MKRISHQVKHLRVGEIVSIVSSFGFFSSGTYRVEYKSSDMLGLSCGEIQLGIDPNFISISARNLQEPVTWLEEEIKLLRHQVKRCDCSDCRAILERKELELIELQQSPALLN